MIYSEADGGIENHHYVIFDRTSTELKIYYPANGSGYDAYNWKLYLKDNLIASSEIVRTQTTIDTGDTLESMDINNLTLDDIAQIVMLRRIYSSLSNEQKNFLSGVISKLGQAEAQLARLLSEQIDSLPSQVTAADRSKVERLRSMYNQCNNQIQSGVTNLDKLAAAEAQLASSGETPTGDKPDNSWMLPTFVSIGAVVVVAAAAVVTVMLLKRKKAQATQTTEEGANNEEK